ncbi:efflux RND transporter periplasmic adaptor subunit [Vibrio porteresiae]|uniref:Efflux RND transporter periplasmic adaptor subunit n=1 Tax=Vibrio porteresiae DSM 19223 TaxID=1123496 RepID=A0ABZ0QCQ5_9VIBR|nr:efflux RND transporter periplasmic adaptor subunit [Vibrio porteresiae]WPC74194.1 efflux RND transporter periplasmic adaptor subunit [Vibrio porteresiae DSM 19223]
MTKVLPRYRNSMIAIGLALALTGCQKETSENVTSQQPQAVAVDTVVLHPQPVEITDKLPGRTSAYRVAEVRPQVEGIIIKRLFVEGSSVKQGDVLYQIDPATYEASLESAKADLASAQATLEKSKLQADRYADLVKNRAISEQDYEDAMATYRAAQASVLAAQAAVKTAQINLDYTKIKAPISGRIGKSSVTEGALVTASQTTALATIQQLDPLYVDLSQPSSTVLKLRQRAKAQSGETSQENQKLSGIKLTLDDGTEIKQEATLQFADVTVNETTGTVNIRALLPNPDDTLLPGLYVRATVPVDYKANAFLVPQAAVSRDTQGRAHINIVSSDNKVEDRVVEADQVIGQNWLVTSGVKDGEQVIVTGLQKIQTGSLVAPKAVDKK